MTDEEIIKSIRRGNHNDPVRFLYKEFPKLQAHILKSGGRKEDAREVFHDALILLIEKLSDPSFQLTSQLTTYLFGIARLLWKNKLRKNNKSIELEWSDTLILSNEDIGYAAERENRIQAVESILTKLSDRCQEIIQRFYYRNESMDAIAKAMQFSSTNSAKTQKYKCMENAIRLCSTQNPQNA